MLRRRYANLQPERCVKLPIVEIINAVSNVAAAVVELAKNRSTAKLDPAITRLTSEDILDQALARARARAAAKK